VTEEKVETEPKAAEELPTGNERILFVDDEKSIVDLAKRILERLGYRVETKMNPVDALELFRSKPDQFDLIITDMAMPQMTGDSLAKEVLNIRPDMPIILCSGYSEKISEENAKEFGIKAFAFKPLVMTDFARVLRKVLDVKRQP
jgi:two-component system cell cycle sensor histidine kinase/response regulator CckA